MSNSNKIKVVIVGYALFLPLSHSYSDGVASKNELLISYAVGQYPTEYIPPGRISTLSESFLVFENHSMEIDVNGKMINLELWDTAG